MGSPTVLLDIYKMKEIKPETRKKLLIKMSNALDNEYAMNWTGDLVNELTLLIDAEESTESEVGEEK